MQTWVQLSFIRIKPTRLVKVWGLFYHRLLHICIGLYDLTHNPSCFLRNRFFSIMTQVLFPRNDSNQLVTQGKNSDSESSHDSAPRYMNGCLKLVWLYSYSTDIFKARSSWILAYSIEITLFSSYDSRSSRRKWLKWIRGPSAFDRNCLDSTTDSSIL